MSYIYLNIQFFGGIIQNSCNSNSYLSTFHLFYHKITNFLEIVMYEMKLYTENIVTIYTQSPKSILTCNANQLGDGKLCVTRPRWHIQHQVLELPPSSAEEQSLHSRHHHWPSPHNCRLFFYQKPHGHTVNKVIHIQDTGIISHRGFGLKKVILVIVIIVILNLIR